MAVSMLGGCAVQTAPETEKGSTKTEQAGDTDTASSVEQTEQHTDVSVEASSETGGQQNALYAGSRPLLIQTASQGDAVSVTPSVTPYTVDADLGNVENLWQLYALQDNQEIAEKLAKNGFVVCGSAGTEFFEIYENNRYEMIPNFVTVDS